MTVIVFSDIKLKNGRLKVEKVFVNPSLEFFKENNKFILKINKTYYPLQFSLQEGKQAIFWFLCGLDVVFIKTSNYYW